MRAHEILESKSKKQTLYCSRKLLNGSDLIEWAKEQGFKKCLDPDDMHVTVAFSKEKIDMSGMTDSFDNVQAEGGEREIKLFGANEDAVVLTFENEDLHHRWEEFCEDFGASWEFEGYHPHVTISYDGLPEGMKLEDIKPYEGVLKFGPEIIKEVDLKWKGKVKETALDSEETPPVAKPTKKVAAPKVDPRDTKQFKEWFRNSKVVGPDGKALVVYHGTARKFAAFNMKKQIMGTIWFTSMKHEIEAGEVGAAGRGHIFELYASIQNPAGWEEYDKFGIGELISRGYDGCILPTNGGFHGIVFEPTQLKSATKNNGNFDRFNRNLNENDPPEIG